MPEKTDNRRKPSWFTRILFWANSFVSFLLLGAYLLPYLPPSNLPLVSVLSLGLPVLIILNVLFLVFWAVLLKRYVLLPLIVLALGYSHLPALYRFRGAPVDHREADFTLMSYNVRQFNRGMWIDNEHVPEDIHAFVLEENPDIVGFQEYDKYLQIDYPEYRYKYVETKFENLALAVYSKFPIVNTGSLDFPESTNNGVFADIVVKGDTLRFINIHLQSLSIDPYIPSLEKEEGMKLFKQISIGFDKQQNQMELVQDAVEQSPYKTIVFGDFNNTAFSYIYKQLAKNKRDAFKEKGKGFGTSFDFDLIPLRIDMVLADDQLQITGYNRYTVKLSDHYPIMAQLHLPDSVTGPQH